MLVRPFCMTVISILIVLSLAVSAVDAQEPQPSFHEQSIDSVNLKRNVHYQVFVPPEMVKNSETDVNNLPVFYVFDGQEMFFYLVSLQQRFRRLNMTPPFYIVGVHTPYPQRYQEFSQFDSMNAFIKQELRPQIHSQYATNGPVILVGWQYAGAFAVSALVEDDVTFAGAIAASPFPLVNKETNAFLATLDAMPAKQPDRFVMIGAGQHRDGQLKVDAERFIQTAKNHNKAKDLDWHFQVFANEDHRSSYADTFYQGTLSYFKGYRALWFKSVADFHNQGGLANLELNIEYRLQRYGHDEEVVNETRWNTVKLALDERDFTLFSNLIKAFADTSFENSLRPSMQQSYGDFFVANQDKSSALRFYKKALAKIPDDKQLADKLAQLEK